MPRRGTELRNYGVESFEMSLDAIIGDATSPQSSPPWIIAHVCNDIGKWGRGFVLALAKRWPSAKAEYLVAYDEGRLRLSDTHFVDLGEGRWVANMIAQRGVHRANRQDIPLRYDALATCLAQVAERATALGASIHMPRIGTGLAGGTWEEVEAVLRRSMDLETVDVRVYDFTQ